MDFLVPSPDWIVGVSGLELCLSNCSWIEHKELNLYPIDAGTDDGITYMVNFIFSFIIFYGNTDIILRYFIIMI